MTAGRRTASSLSDRVAGACRFFRLQAVAPAVRRGRAAAVALLLGLAALASPVPAVASDLPGRYDYLVLVLSWSPSYCEAEGDRASPEQCAWYARNYAFVVHGLWPQNERGWPEDCIIPVPKLDRETVDGMLDVMPSRKLVEHEWARHGTCSGLDADEYFALVRQARKLIRVPQDLQEMYVPATVSPAVIERMFRELNPGLKPDEIAITCDRRRLREVRICMDRDLNFRGCGEIEKRACRSDWILMPPVRKPRWP